jgi:enoyl-CoA hydratase
MSGEGKPLVLLQHDDRIATVTLNNPPANVLSQAVIDQLSLTFQELEQTDLTAVIITGQGGYSFCAGADIKELAENDLSQNEAHFSTIYDTFNLIAACKYPVIAAINGYAYGAGLELALCADIRVMDQNARMSAVCVNLNLVFGTQRLVRLTGPGRAKDLIFCARQLDASEALNFGLAERIAAPGTSWEKAREIAVLISQKGQMAVHGVKEMLNRGLELPLDQALDLETTYVYRMLTTGEFYSRTGKFIMK